MKQIDCSHFHLKITQGQKMNRNLYQISKFLHLIAPKFPDSQKLYPNNFQQKKYALSYLELFSILKLRLNPKLQHQTVLKPVI